MMDAADVCNPFRIRYYGACEPRVRRSAATLGCGMKRLQRKSLNKHQPKYWSYLPADP